MDSRLPILRTVLYGGVLVALNAAAYEFHVDGRAASGGDGTAARPFQTVEAAQNAVRALRASGTLGTYERVDVIFAPGDYRVEKTVALDARDAGPNEDAPVVWRAAQDGTVRFVGGLQVPIRSFSPVTDKTVLARLPGEARGKVVVADVGTLFGGSIPPMSESFGGTPSGPFLFVNHRHLPIARWPNVGFTSFTEVVDHGKVIQKSKIDSSMTVYSPGAFRYSDPRAKRWRFDEGVWFGGYWTHDWWFHSVRAASYGTENGTNDVIRLAHGVPFGVKNKTNGRNDRRFYVFNLLEELDVPGEWYLDRKDGLLYLYPPNGSLLASDEVYFGTLSEPLLRGTDGGLRHFRLQGIAFEYALDDGLCLKGEDIRVDRCKVGCVGKCGISLYGSRNLLRESEVFQCGTCGVAMSGGDRRTLVRADSAIKRCDIHDFGVYQRTYAPGIRLGGCGCTVRANLIHEAPHSACIYDGNEHLFEYNNVYRVLLETTDAGAYYTGRDWTSQGNVLRHNFTHDLGPGGAEVLTMGFYFDDCDCGDEVYGNVFWKVSRGIMINGGREHPIRNNIFADCEIGLSIGACAKTWARSFWNAPGGSWHLEGKALQVGYTNSVWAVRYPRLANILKDSPREPFYNPVEHNVFYNCRKQLVELGGTEMTDALKRSSFTGNLVVNPCGTNGVAHAVPDARVARSFKTLNGSKGHPDTFGFVDPEKGDFRLRPDARLLREADGFNVIPFERIRQVGN